MSKPLRVEYKWLALLLSGIGLFLSSWIVIPAPTSFLLPLGVGAPEISPILLGVNAIALLLALVGIKYSRLRRLILSISLIGILLSALPLLQLPATVQQASAAMNAAIGTDYLARLQSGLQEKMRPQPIVLTDILTGISKGEVRHTSNIRFAAPDGVPLTLELYQPADVGTYPTLITLYGGAWQAGNPGLNSGFNRYMAARGYTVVAIDYRHAPRYRFPTQFEDVQTALTFVRQHAAEYEIDLERIALLGRSSGAHLAALAAYQPNPPVGIRAVVDYYGPVDLTAGYNDPPHPDPFRIQDILEAFIGGSPDALPDRYKTASPINDVRRQVPPTLLIYGSRDHVVKAKFGRSLYDRLQATGNTAVLIEIPWAEHAFDAVFNGLGNQLALYHTERFLAWALQQR